MPKSLVFFSSLSSDAAAAAASLQSSVLQAGLDLGDLCQSSANDTCIVQQCDAVSNSHENRIERG
ncbi:hypothetical protein [Neorickettsia sennetsu]|uniref:Secreted protein n=1 Tax=Ehrlichia sennetsu (strain ATCC VR-367 / Miyayama) TaxID=222891 RepID=Q2GE73_EHRS3|nr:hypothetical protein [Neorickettsia sennetsu]ABD45938.1 hypothetical protein NSE_0334 [Neorickettsia sennetsu str. Miyayama]